MGSIRNFQIQQELGRGTFGVTYLGYDLTRGMNVAVKTINIAKSAQYGADINLINEEIETLKDLAGTSCSKYMACYYDSFQDNFEGEPTIFIISEYINGGSLTNFIGENQGTLAPGVLWAIYNQLLLGLKYIHDRGYAHRDIKPDNIMITNDLNIKYIDFGLACLDRCRIQNCTNTCKTGPGTLLYMSPEFFTGARQDSLAASQAHDVWSLSLVMMELANGLFALPFQVLAPDRMNLLSQDEIINNIVASPAFTSNYQLDDGRTNTYLSTIIINDWRLRPTVGTALELLVEIVLSKVYVGVPVQSAPGQALPTLARQSPAFGQQQAPPIYQAPPTYGQQASPIYGQVQAPPTYNAPPQIQRPATYAQQSPVAYNFQPQVQRPATYSPQVGGYTQRIFDQPNRQSMYSQGALDLMYQQQQYQPMSQGALDLQQHYQQQQYEQYQPIYEQLQQQPIIYQS